MTRHLSFTSALVGGSTLACVALAGIALYSSGVGLIDPKLHRAGGFALALLVAVAVSWQRISGSKTNHANNADTVEPASAAKYSLVRALIDALLIVVGLWSIWSFYTVQSAMETALFGKDLPGILAHTGFSLKEIAEALWYNTNKGVFGSITNIVLSTVFIFIIFGVLLEGTGAGDTLLKFAFLATRKTRGGPAHAAILASSMFGTMSGSTVANIVGTGTFTIPMIKRRGFSPTFAAGIEATASSGGQIMPPIMGAAALVMADLTGVGYLNIIVAALLPALFYYFSLFSAVTVEARRQGIEVQPLSMDDRITGVDWINSILFIAPIVTVIGSLLAGYSTSAAGFYAVVVLLLLCVINPAVRQEPMRVWRSLLKGAESGATLLIAIAAIGILVGSLDSTGLGLKLANVIGEIRGESLFSALMVAMAGALVLSMLTAHMFVFYYGVASSLTPPVAIAAYAAAPIAGANPLMTAFMSFRLGMAKFIIPFIFAFYPTILIVEEFQLLPFIWIVLRSLFCIWLFSSALSAFDRRRLSVLEVIVRFVVAFLILVPDIKVQMLALVAGAVMILIDIKLSAQTEKRIGSNT